MPLTLDDVQRLEGLARLALQAPERAAMVEQLNGFFYLVERMSAVDTQGVEPLSTPLSAVQGDALRLREDRVQLGETGVLLRQAAQASAPLVDEGLYLVPRVVE